MQKERKTMMEKNTAVEKRATWKEANGNGRRRRKEKAERERRWQRRARSEDQAAREPGVPRRRLQLAEKTTVVLVQGRRQRAKGKHRNRATATKILVRVVLIMLKRMARTSQRGRRGNHRASSRVPSERVPNLSTNATKLRKLKTTKNKNKVKGTGKGRSAAVGAKNAKGTKNKNEEYKWMGYYAVDELPSLVSISVLAVMQSMVRAIGFVPRFTQHLLTQQQSEEEEAEETSEAVIAYETHLAEPELGENVVANLKLLPGEVQQMVCDKLLEQRRASMQYLRHLPAITQLKLPAGLDVSPDWLFDVADYFGPTLTALHINDIALLPGSPIELKKNALCDCLPSTLVLTSLLGP